MDAQERLAHLHVWLSGVASVSLLQHCDTLRLNMYAGETAPELYRVLRAMLESVDERLHTIELCVKLSTYHTEVRLRYSASRASNESRPENKEFSLALIRPYQPSQELKTTLFCMVTGVELKESIVGAHTASHNKRTDMEWLLVMKNIDDVRNGVLWSQPIETAYDNSWICFASDPAGGEYRLRVSLADPFPHHSKPKAPLDGIASSCTKAVANAALSAILLISMDMPTNFRPSHGKMLMASVSSLVPLAPDPSSGLAPFMLTWHGISN